jgi:hypothetical protein
MLNHPDEENVSIFRNSIEHDYVFVAKPRGIPSNRRDIILDLYKNNMSPKNIRYYVRDKHQTELNVEMLNNF